MTIRLATSADAHKIVEYNMAMARETEQLELPADVAKAGVEGLLEQPQFGFYVVAEFDGAVVASLMITYEWTDWRDGVFWWLQSVYVHPSHRRQGVFRRMFEFVKQQAATDPRFRGLRLYVDQHNLSAQQAYRDLGLAETAYRLYEQPAGAQKKLP